MEGLSLLKQVSAAAGAEAATKLRRDGVVLLADVLAPDAIDTLRHAVMDRHPEFADKALLTDFQDNGPGRFIAPVAISRGVWGSGLLQHPALAALAAGALGKDWVVDAFGMLMAFPGCTEQKPHRDGEQLFPDAPLAAVLPPYALTVLVPLVDVAIDGGATAFRLGTQRYGPSQAGVPPSASAVERGSILVWDFETLHWGLANTGPDPRPALYLTLCRPFWTDMKNFGGKSRVKLVIDPEIVPLVDRRFARASEGSWGHHGLGKSLPKYG